jgi:hypothetical protein
MSDLSPTNSAREKVHTYVMLARTGRPEVDYDGITSAIVSLITEAETKAEQRKTQEVLFWTAEYVYKLANPDTKMNTPNVAYEMVENAYRAHLAALKETHE